MNLQLRPYHCNIFNFQRSSGFNFKIAALFGVFPRMVPQQHILPTLVVVPSENYFVLKGILVVHVV